MDTLSNEYGAPLSGIPPLPFLSGLNLGSPNGLSGAQDATMSGAGANAGVQPGMAGGLDLAQLSELLQAGAGEPQAPGVGMLNSLFAPIGGTIGQGGQGGYGIAGGTLSQGESPGTANAAQGYTAGQTGPSSPGGIDGLQLIKQALGLVQKGAGVLSQSQPSGAPSGAAGSTDEATINPTGYSLTQAGGTASPEGDIPGLTSFFGGQFGGQDLLADPTFGPLLTQGLLTGSLTPSDIANFSTLGGDQLAGLRTALASGEVQNDLGAQLLNGGGATGTGVGGLPANFTLGGNNQLNTSLSGYTTPGTNYGGLTQGGLSGALGLVNLLQGLNSENPYQTAGGGLSAAGGALQALMANPDLANSLGLGEGVGGALGAGIGGLGGILNLIQGAQTGNPLQIGTGALGALTGASGAYGALSGLAGGTGAGAISTLAATIAPETAAAIASALGVNVAATAGTQAIASALSTAISATAAAYALPVAAVVMWVTSAISNREEMAARHSGWWNNPIVGGLYNQAGQAINASANLDRAIQGAGGLQGLTDQQLQQAAQGYTNNLLPFYYQAQGGYRPVSGKEATGAPGMMTPQEWEAQQSHILSQYGNVFQELARRGIGAEQLRGYGTVNPKWLEQGLAGVPLQQAVQQQLGTQVPATSPVSGLAPGSSILADPGLSAIAYGAGFTPEATAASAGGQLLAPLAYLNPALYQQIGGAVNLQNPLAQAEMERMLEGAALTNQVAQQAFTSGGS